MHIETQILTVATVLGFSRMKVSNPSDSRALVEPVEVLVCLTGVRDTLEKDFDANVRNPSIFLDKSSSSLYFEVRAVGLSFAPVYFLIL